MPHNTDLNLQFSFDARDGEGRSQSGTIAAIDRQEAGMLLRERGLFVIRLSAPAVSASTRPGGRVRRSDVVWQMWQLAVMVEGGIGLSESLACLARQSRRPALRAVLESLSTRVEEGIMLSEAMSQHPSVFPQSLIAMIRASELNGTLSVVLRRSAQYLVKDLEVLRKVQNALVYPILMAGLCLGVTTFLLTFVLPRFAQIFASRGAVLPAPTRMLMAISDGLVSHWAVWLASAILFAGAAYLWLRTPTGRRQLDRFVISTPPLAVLFNSLHQSRAFRALATLLETKAPLMESIRVTREVVPSVHYQELWQEVEEQVRVGEKLAAPFFHAPFVDEAVAQLIDSGDRAGQLSNAFARLAEFMEQRYDHALSASIKLLEPLMILLMGTIVGFVAIAMLLPLFQAAGVVAGR